MKKITSLTIDRAKWLNGKTVNLEPDKTSCLLSKATGRMCCLGFLARACGAKAGQIREKTTPDTVPNLKWPAGLLLHEYQGLYPDIEKEDSELTNAIINTNDAPKMARAKREQKIKTLFKKAGIKVKFVGRTPTK